MQVQHQVLILCWLFFNSISSLFGVVIPKWSKNYHLRGSLHAPEANVVQDFEVWYDQPSKRSRVDYYFGMMKTYQTLDSAQYGSEDKVFPFTNDTHRNVKMCLKVAGTMQDPITLQPVLYPVENMFRFQGHVRHNGKKVQKWLRTETQGYGLEKRFLRFVFLIKCRENLIDIICRPKCTPIRLEMEGRDLVLGNHVGYYYIDYHEYQPNIVRQTTLINTFADCRSEESFFEGRRRKKTPDSIGTFLPSIARVVEEDRGFDAFTAKHGSEFASMKQFRKLFRVFRRAHMKRKKFKTKLKQFFNPKNVNRDSYRLPTGLRHRLRTNRRKLMNEEIEYFFYTDEDKQLVVRNPSYDLRSTMNPAQSQLNCGSCWAFATIATIEGAYYKKYNQIIKLSEQVLIDCSWGLNNLGCDGGVDFHTVDWIMTHGGVPYHIDYGPYRAKNGFCTKYNDSEEVQVSRYVPIESDDVLAVQIALIKHGPVLTSMHAGLDSFQRYSGGVYNDPDCPSDEQSLDHSVVIVGYGRFLGRLYWIVRNSWSTTWGQNGHFMIDAEYNNCGLLNNAAIIEVV